MRWRLGGELLGVAMSVVDFIVWRVVLVLSLYPIKYRNLEHYSWKKD